MAYGPAPFNMNKPSSAENSSQVKLSTQASLQNKNEKLYLQVEPNFSILTVLFTKSIAHQENVMALAKCHVMNLSFLVLLVFRVTCILPEEETFN